jgi:hypothetical protein
MGRSPGEKRRDVGGGEDGGSAGKGLCACSECVLLLQSGYEFKANAQYPLLDPYRQSPRPKLA